LEGRGKEVQPDLQERSSDNCTRTSYALVGVKRVGMSRGRAAGGDQVWQKLSSRGGNRKLVHRWGTSRFSGGRNVHAKGLGTRGLTQGGKEGGTRGGRHGKHRHSI